MRYHNEFWAFMNERELIRQRRLEGYPIEQWTNDVVFQLYRFTNVKRIHDRTTALLWEEFYQHKCKELEHPSPVGLLNAMLFRYHGTIDSARAIGWHDSWDSQDEEHLIGTNSTRALFGEKVFTAAYVIPNCGSADPKHEVVAKIITEVWEHSEYILNGNCWETVCNKLCEFWGVGTFMAKEVLLDYILTTGWSPLDWETWTPIGPGGRLGAGIVKYGGIVRIPDSEAIGVIRELYEMRHERWPEENPSLDLTDIQFQLCEFAKYIKAVQGYGRPKRKFQPIIDRITMRQKE